MVGDAVALDETNELRRRVACERRAAEIRVLRQKARRPRVDVREVAPAAAGDADLFADDVVVLDEQHPAAALPGLGGAHHAGGASADDDHVPGGAQCSCLGCAGIPWQWRWRWPIFIGKSYNARFYPRAFDRQDFEYMECASSGPPYACPLRADQGSRCPRNSQCYRRSADATVASPCAPLTLSATREMIVKIND